MSDSLINFFNNKKNIFIINNCLKSGLNFINKNDNKTSILHQEIIVFTGSLDNFTRSEVKNVVEEYGGIFSKSITHNTTMLVVCSGGGSKKIKAKIMNIKTLFIELTKKF